MNKSVKRAAARVVPASLRSRLRAAGGSARRDPSAPATQTAADDPAAPMVPVVPVVPTVGVDWSMTELAGTDTGWRVTIALPEGSVLRGAALVLVGRSSGRHVLVPAGLADGRAQGELERADLDRFAGEVVDLWVEPVASDAPMGWRRVTVAGSLAAVGSGLAPDDGARWYTTAKGNVSVRVAAEADRAPEPRPQLGGLTRVTHGARVTVTGAAVAGATLVLLGASSRREVEVETAVEGDVLVATVPDEVLGGLGTELVGLYVGEAEGARGERARHRVRTAAQIDFVSGSSVRRHWFASPEGFLHLRRKSPVEVIADSGVFDAEYYRGQVPGLGDDVDLVEHYVTTGAARGLDPSAMFDTEYYRKMNPDVRGNGLAHFCEHGWLQLRNPSPLFDTWWYWSKHLDLASTDVNPLAHYEATGKAQGLSPRPSLHPSRRLGTGHRFAEGATVRRLCLFAGYDADGVVDDYVVDYVRELSRHADVHYWADSEMSASELKKLDGVAVTATASRHGEYDFGSYRRLVEAVGWDTIEQYDEMLLVNDSGYLLCQLDDVFDRMRGKEADWWGLQATKGLAQTRRLAANLFQEPIPMERVRSALVDAFERDYVYDFHVGSYFLAYRKPVIEDPEFRRYFSSITSQREKRNIIKMYEIGLTRWLIHHGHSFDTFVSKLYPFHPVYTDWYFRLLDEGFPLLKRFLLTQNHYNVPNLWQWEQRVLEKQPDADTAVIRRNLERSATPDRLRRTLQIGTESGVVDDPPVDHLLSRTEFIEADRVSPKHGNWWAFPVCGFSHRFSGNERAIFEEVKNDPAIRKIVFTRDREVRVQGANVDVVPLMSPEGQHLLMRCGNIFIKHSTGRNVVHPVSGELHNLIQVWHGIPFKRIGYASSDFLPVLDRVIEDQSSYRAVISSSKVDSLAMAAAFYPLTIHQVWNTGLPRNDFIVREEGRLPRDLRDELQSVRALLGGKRLLLFMPTFRNAQTNAYYRFDDAEIAWLNSWLEENDCILGVREHMADSARLYSSQLQGVPMLHLSEDAFPNVEVLYRAAAALVTDYSSAFIDFTFTGRPVVSFAYDYEAYLMERGGFYDLDMVFPGAICKSFEELKSALSNIFTAAPEPLYEFKRRLFFDRVDDRAASRVVERVRDLTEAHGVGKPLGERLA